MAIKIYETQVKPTSEIAARPTTAGMRVSQATAAQIGTAFKGAAQTATKLYAEIETRKSENEVLEKSRELLEGNDNFEGLSMAVEKAGMMDDPDEAVKYYNNALAKAKINVGGTFKHRFSKKMFDQYLKKQEIKDGIVVRKNSNKAFIAKSQTLELENIEKLKKDVVYGETNDLKNIALNDLNNILNSEKFQNLFGPESEKIKKGSFADIEFYKAKREIDVNPEQGLANAIKNINNLDTLEKLKAYAGKNRQTINETAKETLKVMEDQLKDYSLPDVSVLENIIDEAASTQDNSILDRANKVLLKGQVLSELKTMNYQELSQANSAAITVKEGADPDVAMKSEIIRDFYNEISSSLIKDPITTAKNIGVFNNISTLPISDLLNNPAQSDTVANAMSQRIIQAKSISAFYGVQAKYFSEDEKSQLTDFFENNRNKDQLVRVLSTINKTFGQDAGQAFIELAPKVPFFAHLGGLITKTERFGGDGYKKAIAGYDIVKNKQIAPGIKKTESRYKSTKNKYREAFPDSVDTYNNIIESAEYIYAYEMYIKGKDDTTFDQKLFEKAIQLSAGQVGNFGGIDKYNDTHISIPSWMKQGQFSDVVDQLRDNPELFKQAIGNQEGVGVSMRDGSIRQIDVFKNNPNPEFITVGDGRYKISLGDHPFKGTPRYVMTKNFDLFKGNQMPLILDLNLIKSKIQE